MAAERRHVEAEIAEHVEGLVEPLVGVALVRERANERAPLLEDLRLEVVADPLDARAVLLREVHVLERGVELDERRADPRVEGFDVPAHRRRASLTTHPGRVTLRLTVSLTLRLVLGATLGVGLGAVSPATVNSRANRVTNSVTYVDERGEDAGSPDIRSVVVSNDDTGVVTLRVNMPSHPAMADDMRIQVSLSDGDAATGDGRGRHRRSHLRRSHLVGAGGAQFLGCSGSVCGGPDPSLYAYKPTLFRYSYASGIARFTMDLGIPVTPRRATRLDFRVNASAGWVYDPAKGFDPTNVHRDAIPARYDEFLT